MSGESGELAATKARIDAAIVAALDRLDAAREQRDEDSCRSNTFLSFVVTAAETAVDHAGGLTRAHPNGSMETASLSFDDAGWHVRVKARNKKARGRGAHGFYEAAGMGWTPKEALDSFFERLAFFVQATA